MILLHAAIKDLRLRLRDPIALLLWLGIPLMVGGLITLAFGGQSTPKASVLVVNHDQGFLANFLMGAMTNESNEIPFSGEPVTEEDGRQRINDGEATALLIIPEGFTESVLKEEKVQLDLVLNPAQRILPSIVEEALTLLTEIVFYGQRIFGTQLRTIAEAQNKNPFEAFFRMAADPELVEKMTRLGLLLDPPAISADVLVEKQDTGVQKSMGQMFLPAMLFMALFFMAQGISEDIWREKDQGTLRRFLSTPNGFGQFLGGKVLATTLLQAVVVAVGLMAAKHLFEMPLRNLGCAVLWCSAAGTMLTLLMMLLQMTATNQRSGNLLTNLVMMPLLMLGGSFFPFEAMPKGMADIGQWTPNGFSVKQLTLLLDGQTQIPDLLQPTGILLAVVAVLFFFCVRRASGGFVRS